jgi:uncharacterized Zn-binding protein involved in type VI secretion
MAQCHGSHGLPCCPHDFQGWFDQGSPTTFNDGRASVRLNDHGYTNCPHCSDMWASSYLSTVFIYGLGSHRLGDEVVTPCGSGVTVEGSPTVIDG